MINSERTDFSVIAIIDYGAGNLCSVKNALDFIGTESMVTSDAKAILSADKVILPGVGAFGEAAVNLRRSGLSEVINKAINSGMPFLGICLGLQLLFENSDESVGETGLAVFEGSIKDIPKTKGLKIPHMGWNSLDYKKDSRLFHGIGDEPFVYFVHSYYMVPKDESIISAYTEYGIKLGVAAEKDNIYATQFHPEKSGECGLKILRNFAENI